MENTLVKLPLGAFGKVPKERFKERFRKRLVETKEGLQRSKNNREIRQGDDGMRKVPRYVQILMKED